MSEVKSQQNPRMPSLLWLLSLKQGPPRVADVPSSLNHVLTKMASFGRKGEPYFSCQPPPISSFPRGRYRRTEEERVRCFLLRNTTAGQLVAQSADATCHGGLQSPTDGYITFNMTPTEARQGRAAKHL